MPPGYAAFFLWVAAAVLWWSGWREETAQGIPDRAVAVFLAGWPMTAWKNTTVWDAGSGIQVNGAFMWTTLAMVALVLRMERQAAWRSLSAGVLAGSFSITLFFSPLLYVMTPDWISGPGPAFIVAITAAVLTQGASGQFVAVTAALCLHEGLSAAWLGGSAPVPLGTARWMEGWWIALLAARIASYTAAAAVRVGRSRWKREGERT